MRIIPTGAGAVALAAIALTTATACGSSDRPDGSGRTSTLASSTPGGGSSTAPSAHSAASVGRLAEARRAVRAAERGVPRGKAYDIETDRLRGRRVWEVKVARGTAQPYELDVSAGGDRVLRRTRASKVSDDVRKVARATVSLQRALSTAGRRVGQGTFDEAEIDRVGGRIVWEATFKRSGDRETEVKVDARSGKVVGVSTDD
jgi:uncharacterized membrane protein YkoI